MQNDLHQKNPLWDAGKSAPSELRQAHKNVAGAGKYTDRNFVDNFLQVVIYLVLVANI